MTELSAILTASARVTRPGPFDLMHLIPGNGMEPASAWLITAAEDATGVPVPRSPGVPVNIARVRHHLREFVPQSRP